MLRHAEEKDQAVLLDYLRREPEFNLFIIGDILNFGVRSTDMEVFVEEDPRGVEAVLMRYRENLVACTHLPALDLSAVAAQVNAFLATGGTWFVSGKKDVVDRLKPGLEPAPLWERDQFFSVCRELRAEAPPMHLSSVQIASVADADEIAALWDTVFGPRPDRRLRQDIEQHRTRVAIIREGASGRLAAAAASVAESDSAAMIIGVATHAEHRRKGYASACVRRLVGDLRTKGKSACLFFSNPEAGTIYHRLGFRDIGMWKMLKFAGERDPADVPQ